MYLTFAFDDNPDRNVVYVMSVLVVYGIHSPQCELAPAISCPERHTITQPTCNCTGIVLYSIFNRFLSEAIRGLQNNLPWRTRCEHHCY